MASRLDEALRTLGVANRWLAGRLPASRGTVGHAHETSVSRWRTGEAVPNRAIQRMIESELALPAGYLSGEVTVDLQQLRRARMAQRRPESPHSAPLGAGQPRIAGSEGSGLDAASADAARGLVALLRRELDALVSLLGVTSTAGDALDSAVDAAEVATPPAPARRAQAGGGLR